MPKKTKYSVEEKAEAVLACIDGKCSVSSMAKRMGVDNETIRDWIGLYTSEGSIGLQPAEQNRIYSPEMKRQAVEDYLSGKGSLREICQKYKIRSKSELQDWIKVYNSGGEFKHKMSGGSRMKNTRKTTQEERVRIAKECIEKGYNYGETAIKYQVSYQQVYTWVKKFAEKGESGLEDRRGQRTAHQEPRTELERLQIENARLKHELYMAEMVRDLLKKLEEIERRDAYRR